MKQANAMPYKKTMPLDKMLKLMHAFGAATCIVFVVGVWLHARKCANIDPATCMFIYIFTTVAMPLVTCPKPPIKTFSVATPSANGNKPTTTGASSEQCATTTSYSSFYKPHDLMHFLMFSWATTIVTLHGV